MVADLPVGEHLQDHLMTEAVVYTLDQPVTMHPTSVNLYTKLQYMLFGTGRHTHTHADKYTHIDGFPIIIIMVNNNYYGKQKAYSFCEKKILNGLLQLVYEGDCPISVLGKSMYDL